MQHQLPISACDPPLADTLRLMMPCATTTLLLQAALLQSGAAGEAWLKWRQTIADPKAFLASDRVGIKRHLPLLYRNLTAHQVDVGRDLEPYFRAARAREELRSARYRRFLGEALGALQRSGVEFVVGKGVTVGETIHADPVVRHSHDIDLLVRPGDLATAAEALQKARFPSSATHSPRGEPRFVHESGLPVELHHRLYRTPFYDGDLTGVWDRARAGEALGMPVRLISDVDLLVQAPVHASVVPQRCGLSWIVDVASLLQRRDAEGTAIDWASVIWIAGEAGATLPLYVTYHYLATTFKAPIPRQVIEELGRSAQGRTAAASGGLGRPALRSPISADQSAARRQRMALARGDRQSDAAAAAGISQGNASGDTPVTAGANLYHTTAAVCRQAIQPIQVPIAATMAGSDANAVGTCCDSSSRRVQPRIMEAASCLLPWYSGGGSRWGPCKCNRAAITPGPHPNPPPEYQGRGQERVNSGDR